MKQVAKREAKNVEKKAARKQKLEAMECEANDARVEASNLKRELESLEEANTQKDVDMTNMELELSEQAMVFRPES